nr:hypothetical protein [Tanacetum cinerariifolium]
MAYLSSGSSSSDTENLTKLVNSQISAKDKTGLGYDGHMNESEVVHNVFNSRESEVFKSAFDSRVNENEENNDRFKES